MTNRSGPPADHPRGLRYLVAAEGWERFSYMGMQSLLVLYLTRHLLVAGRADSVLGLGALRSAIESVTGPLTDGALASQIFGLYSALVYLTPVLGGLLADRLGRRTLVVLTGGLLMAAGHFLMASEPGFLIAIALLLAGVGCFKGNIAGQVGELYPPGEPRRAAGFQIFQLGIAVAAVLSPLVCGTLGEKVSWHAGFAAAGVGMLIGLATYLRGRRWLPADRRDTPSAAGPAPRWTPREWKTMALLIGLIPIMGAIQIGNDQMYNAFIVWGQANFDLTLAGFAMPVTWLLSADAVLAIVCQIVALVAWRAWSRRRREPDDIVKIALGAVVMAAAPLLLAAASRHGAVSGARLSPAWGLGFELMNEIGFALVAPVGLSLFSQAAPPQVQGLMLGVYYLAFSLTSVAVGRLGGLLETMPATDFWLLHAGIIAVAAVLVVFVAIKGRGLLVPRQESEVAPA